MGARRTVVEQSIERAVREQLRDVCDYWSSDTEQREHIEGEVRESIRLSREEDEV
jgi:hypothetical protein